MSQVRKAQTDPLVVIIMVIMVVVVIVAVFSLWKASKQGMGQSENVESSLQPSENPNDATGGDLSVSEN